MLNFIDIVFDYYSRFKNKIESYSLRLRLNGMSEDYDVSLCFSSNI
jgi:hypothetical protein